MRTIEFLTGTRSKPALTHRLAIPAHIFSGLILLVVPPLLTDFAFHCCGYIPIRIACCACVHGDPIGRSRRSIQTPCRPPRFIQRSPPFACRAQDTFDVLPPAPTGRTSNFRRLIHTVAPTCSTCFAAVTVRPRRSAICVRRMEAPTSASRAWYGRRKDFAGSATHLTCGAFFYRASIRAYGTRPNINSQ